MNPSKSAFGVRARLPIALVGLTASLHLSALAEKPATDPIVGRWNWHNHTVLLIQSNGTCGWHENDGIGTWKCVSPSQDPRKYMLDWNRGQYVETLYLKRHAAKISGHDQFGNHVWGFRIED
jgi:hypothetical protein